MESLPLLKKRNLPTLEDVARVSEVSTATVSRCLNEPDKVSEKTRDRVMNAVNQLNYVPNFGARAIAANRTGIFGVVIPTMENAIFARGIEAFQEVLLAKNATMLVASSGYDPEQEAKQIRALVGRGADGLLVIGFHRDQAIYEFLSEREIPIVSAWNCTTDKTQSYVGFNNQKASSKLMQTALSLGHKSFAYIAAHTEMNDRARDRLLGARSAIENAGFDAHSMPVIETDYSIKSGHDAFLKIANITKGKPPTLVICGNDVLAVGAIQAAKELGLDVPGDVSVVGFDDIELSTVISPSLTTVHVPHEKMGSIAAECLHDLVTGVETIQQIELETYIVKRDSLAPPKYI
jgi:LacI family transcriptional regulator